MEDRRIRKSKAALKDSLLTLMTEPPLMKITVKDIVQHADLNRSTFYTYYKDVAHMASSLEDEIHTEILGIIDDYIERRHHIASKELETFSLQFIHDLCLVVLKHAEFCQRITGPNGDISFILRLGKSIEDNIKVLFSELFAPDFGYYPYMYAFIKGGYIGILQRWMSTDFEADPETISLTLYRYTVSVIHSYNQVH